MGTQKLKRPRPQGDKKERRTEVVYVALTPTEKEKLDARRGLVSAAAWLRDRGLNA